MSDDFKFVMEVSVDGIYPIILLLVRYFHIAYLEIGFPKST